MSPLIYLFRSFLRNYPGRQNGLLLLSFLIIFVVCVAAHSLLFHVFMAYEGKSHGWLTGLYWTLTVMSTLGFGDITFSSDLGRVYTICVLISGVGFFLILLPILFLESQSVARVPRELPRDTRGHVVLCHYGSVASALIARLTQYHQSYVLLVPDLSEALRLHDGGLHVMVGEIDHPETFVRARATQAALVVTTSSDASNVNVTFTVRDAAPDVPMIATANEAVAVNMLKLAGCSHALHLGDMLGRSLARRIHGGDTATHVIGQFDQLLIAEADAGHTPMVGATLRQSRLREWVGLSVVGVWERGHFEMAGPETCISEHTILVLAGSREQLRQYDRQFGQTRLSDAPVVIVGGGRVGRATGEALEARGLDYRIVEKQPEHVSDPLRYIVGDATDIEVLRKAGLMEAPTVVMTTHDDDINIYLTQYCRFLRPDIQIISRATFERNVPTLHRAGADFVMSYASMGANAIWNLLQRSDVLMVTEGLNVFKVPLPSTLVGQTIVEAEVRQKTGCHVIAVQTTDGVMQINPDPTTPLPDQGEIILIGTAAAERQFLHQYT